MISSTCHATVELIDPLETYTNGDIVRGKVHVEASRNIDVQVVEAKLRCEEVAVVWISNGQGAYSHTEREKLLTLTQRLYPKGSFTVVENEDFIENPLPRGQLFKLPKGQHTYEFAFMIPSVGSYPGTLKLRNSSARVEWYVKAIVRRPELTASNTRAFCPFHMVPAQPPPSFQNLITYCESARLKVHLPGCSTGIKGLFSDSDHRRNSEIRMTVTVPDAGVPQYPDPLSVDLSIECESPEHTILKHLEVYLKQKTTIFVDKGWHHDVVRDKHSVFTIDSSCHEVTKGGLDSVRDAIRDAKIYQNLVGSFGSPHFIHEYKLVAEAVVASRLKPSTKTRLRISVPVHIMSRNVAGHSIEFPEQLPQYAPTALPDEELLSPPAFPGFVELPPPV